jgi:hypothetical protein
MSFISSKNQLFTDFPNGFSVLNWLSIYLYYFISFTYFMLTLLSFYR